MNPEDAPKLDDLFYNGDYDIGSPIEPIFLILMFIVAMIIYSVVGYLAYKLLRFIFVDIDYSGIYNYIKSIKL